jgi:hypothetical protein
LHTIGDLERLNNTLERQKNELNLECNDLGKELQLWKDLLKASEKNLGGMQEANRQQVIQMSSQIRYFTTKLDSASE